MTAAAARKAFDQAEDVAPEPPRLLVRDLPPADPYPVQALGQALHYAAAGIVDKVQVPPAMAGNAVLAVAALAVQGHIDVELPTGHAVPTSLFLASVAASGDRKTGADREASWPIRRREEALRDAYRADATDYADARVIFDREKDRILSDKKRDKSGKAAAIAALGPAPLAPLEPLLTCPEPTLEGLARLYMIGSPSLGVFSAEGGSFVGGHAMTDEAKLRSAAGFSTLWDGEPLKRVRAGDGVQILAGRRLSIHLAMQPGVAAAWLSDPVLQDQGLFSRVLVAAPDSLAGTRYWRDPLPQSDADLRRYGARLLSILERPVPVVEGTRQELAPRRLPLSWAARDRWIGFADEIEAGLGDGGAYSAVRPLAAKAPEHAARIAAVLAAVEDLDAAEVTAPDLDRGITVIRHYLSEAIRLSGVAEVDAGLDAAAKLLRWLQTEWSEPAIGLPEIYRLGPPSFRTKAAASAAVATLEDHGWLRRIEKGATIRGTRRRDAWLVVRPDRMGE